MSKETDRIQFLWQAINDAIDYQRKENSVSYAEVIGVLEIVKMEVHSEMKEQEAEREEE